MTWQEVSRSIGVSTSTISRLRHKKGRSAGVIETDGVLAMVRWLGRTVESFTGVPIAAPAEATGNDVLTSGRFLRFNTRALHGALDAERSSRGMTWQAVAQEISLTQPVSASMLTGLKRGGRIGVYETLAIVGAR